MATQHQQHSLMSYQNQHPHQQQQLSTKTMVIATIVGLTIGGPLLSLMAFFFVSTMALFVVSSPLLIIFSPVLMGAGFVIVAALAGFGAAGLLAIAGLAALGWVTRAVKGGQLQQGVEAVTGKVVDAGERVKDKGREWAGQVKQTVQNATENATASRSA